MTEQMRISGKDLGALARPDFCPRCFWIRRHAPDGLPYQVFPGIFSSIDAYSKHVIHGWFDRHGGPPPWLAGLGDLTGYIDPPHFTKFNIVDPATDILLTGVADGIYVRPDGSKLIVDYKTARYTAHQDHLMPVYVTQLNAYARIAEGTGISPVTGLALIYTEPESDQTSANVDAVHKDDGFLLGFNAVIHWVDLDTAMLPPLLERARRIYDLSRAPESADGCKECSKLDGLFGLDAGW